MQVLGGLGSGQNDAVEGLVAEEAERALLCERWLSVKEAAHAEGAVGDGEHPACGGAPGGLDELQRSWIERKLKHREALQGERELCGVEVADAGAKVENSERAGVEEGALNTSAAESLWSSLVKLQQVDVTEASKALVEASCKSVVTMVDKGLLATGVPVLAKLGGKGQ